MDFYREIHGKRSGGKKEIEPYANGIVPLAFYKGGNMKALFFIMETLLWTCSCFFFPALCLKVSYKVTRNVFKKEGSISGGALLVIALIYAAMTLRSAFTVFSDMGLWIIPFWIFWMIADLFFFYFVWNK